MSKKVPNALKPNEWRQGVVILGDWKNVPWQQDAVYGFAGEVMLCESKDAAGFSTTGGGHAGWIAIVRGKKTTHVVAGCKIATITYDTEVNNTSIATVP